MFRPGKPALRPETLSAPAGHDDNETIAHNMGALLVGFSKRSKAFSGKRWVKVSFRITDFTVCQAESSFQGEVYGGKILPL
jgi:hypothetical protein